MEGEGPSYPTLNDEPNSPQTSSGGENPYEVMEFLFDETIVKTPEQRHDAIEKLHFGAQYDVNEEISNEWTLLEGFRPLECAIRFADDSDDGSSKYDVARKILEFKPEITRDAIISSVSHSKSIHEILPELKRLFLEQSDDEREFVRLLNSVDTTSRHYKNPAFIQALPGYFDSPTVTDLQWLINEYGVNPSVKDSEGNDALYNAVYLFVLELGDEKNEHSEQFLSTSQDVIYFLVLELDMKMTPKIYEMVHENEMFWKSDWLVTLLFSNSESISASQSVQVVDHKSTPTTAFKAFASSAKREELFPHLDPSVLEESFLEKLKDKYGTIVSINTKTRDPARCIDALLVNKFTESVPLTNTVIMACKKFYHPKERPTLVLYNNWTAQTIALALGRPFTLPREEDFTLGNDEYNLEMKDSSDTGISYLDTTGEAYRNVRQHKFTETFADNLLPLSQVPSSEELSITSQSLETLFNFKVRLKGYPEKIKRGLRMENLPDVDDNIWVLSFSKEHGETRLHQVWVFFDSSLREKRAANVTVQSGSGHAIVANLRNNHVRMWEPNTMGLQSVAAQLAEMYGCEDEMEGGWCATWSTFYLEELFLNEEIFFTDQIKEAVQKLLSTGRETVFMKHFVDLFGSIGAKKNTGTQADTPETLPDRRSERACSLTNFVRLLAMRYFDFQDKGLQSYVSSLSTRRFDRL